MNEMGKSPARIRSAIVHQSYCPEVIDKLQNKCYKWVMHKIEIRDVLWIRQAGLIKTIKHESVMLQW